MLLHVQQGQTSRIERYRCGVLAPRVVGFYRHNDRAADAGQKSDA
jgi:hypothetical protein